MQLRARHTLWLLGLGFAACRMGYDELDANRSGSVSGGASGGAATGAGATSSSAAGDPGTVSNAAGEATTPGGGSSATGGGTGSVTAGEGSLGQAGDAGTVGGAPSCSGATALTSNGSPSAPPAVTCAYPGALVCDDFEAGQEPYWTVVAAPPAQATLQSCIVHGGNQALGAYPVDSINRVQLQEQLLPTVGTGSLFVRAFLYLPSSAALPNWTVLYEVWDSPTKWDNKISIDLQPDGTVTLNNWAGAGQQKTSLASALALIPRDQWTCLELEIVVDKVNGATRLYLDDQQVITSSGAIRTRGTRAFSTVSMGAVPGDSPIQLYQDDFVVATQRIGCN